MSTSKGRMLARTGWQGWDCTCCGPEPTKGQKRAREKREWMTAEQNADHVRAASEAFIKSSGGFRKLVESTPSFDARCF